MGTILLQRDSKDMLYLMYYSSGRTTATKENYISYELEVLAIVKRMLNRQSNFNDIDNI